MSTNWQEVGFNDGKAGNPYANILQRGERCASANLRLDTRQNQQGHLNGLHDYCTYQNGMNIGLQGKQALEVCPAGLKARFIQGWEAGSRQYCK